MAHLASDDAAGAIPWLEGAVEQFGRFTNRQIEGRFLVFLAKGLLLLGRLDEAALVMGTLAALLAGACVAPVVIAVLVYSAAMYTGGAAAGLIYPFLLGVGMALPWPLAGAGM